MQIDKHEKPKLDQPDGAADFRAFDNGDPRRALIHPSVLTLGSPMHISLTDHYGRKCSKERQRVVFARSSVRF